jgi:hypothetical protein
MKILVYLLYTNPKLNIETQEAKFLGQLKGPNRLSLFLFQNRKKGIGMKKRYFEDSKSCKIII